MTEEGQGGCLELRSIFMQCISGEKRKRLDGASATWDCVYGSCCSSGNLFKLKQRGENREKCACSVNAGLLSERKEAQPDEMFSAGCVSSQWGPVWEGVGPHRWSTGWPGCKNIVQRWSCSLAKWCHYKFIPKAQLHRAPDLQKIILKLNALLEMKSQKKSPS